MKIFKTLSGTNLSWIGIGSYGIGGRGHRDVQLTEKKTDKTYIEALEYQFDLGYNFSEISPGYGHGNAAKLFSQAIKSSKIKREDLFVTNSAYPRDYKSFEEVKNDIEEMYKVFDTEYFDSTLVTQSLAAKFGYKEVVEKLKELLTKERTRYVSLSNAGPKFIQRFHNEFGDRMFAHESHISFEVRVNQDKGIFDLCDKLGIENIIWRPLRRNATSNHNWELLKELAEKYKKTQNQIILNWIAYLGHRPMVMSSSKDHIKENWMANEFEMEKNDYKRMTEFRVPNIKIPEIDWEKNGKGVSMATFACRFDEYYREQR